jgi:hypothetical protein
LDDVRNKAGSEGGLDNMTENTKIKRSARVYAKRRFYRSKKAVSEALGTILLLAVAIVLVSAMFVWTQTIPELDEGRMVSFIADYSDGNISIRHQGGDPLKNSDTEIRLIINDVAMNYSIDMDPLIGTDNLWTAGESWKMQAWDPQQAGVDPRSLEVWITDIPNQMLLFSDTLHTSTTITDLPDLSVLPQNVTFQYPGNMIRRGIWTNVSVTINNLGDVDVTNAVVRIFAGSTVLTEDGESQQVIDVAARSSERVWVNWTPEAWGMQTIFVKVYSGFSELDYSNNYAFVQVVVDIPTSIIHGPDLQMTSWDILMYPEFPTRGDDVRVTVVVHNLGDESVTSSEGATLIVRDTEISWNTTTDRANYRDGVFLNETFYNISVPASGIVQKDFVWKARPGGNVTIYAYIDVNNSVVETEENFGALEFNNLGFRLYRIMPKILLVDDDNVTSGEYDSGGSLRNAMIAAGATFDMYFTSSNNDPEYDFGSKQLKDYDIVVWTTGYEKENTITPANIEAIKRAMDNGTYLWLVGQDVIPELSLFEGDADGDPDPNEFAFDFLGVDEFTLPSGGAASMLEGIADNPISDGLRLNLSSVNKLEDRSVNISALKSNAATDRISGLFYNTTELGLDGNASLAYYNISHDFKTVYFGHDFSAINNPVMRAQVAFKVLKWLNWTLTFGTDFAVAEETFSKAEPRYLDRVWINATLLNNGPDDENVTVAFYVTGPDGQERLIQQYPDFQKNPFSIEIPGEGGRVLVSKQWLATDVGLHDFRVVVDPFDAFTEISEENNDITYSDLDTELDVAFAILIVDDDNSTNNGGNDVDMVSDYKTAIDLLGYDYDVNVVPGGLLENEGPNVEILKHYNAVFWITGTADNHTLNNSDQDSISKYLTGGYEEAGFIPNLRVNFFMMGSNLLEDLNGSGTDIDPLADSFLEKYFKIDRYTTDVNISGTLQGVKDHRVSHGIDYPRAFSGAAASADLTSDLMVPASGASGMFWSDNQHNSYSAISYNNSEYQLAFIPWSISSIAPSNFSTETNQSEFVFLMLNWFGYPEKRTELRTYSVDIELNDDNPVIGYSYVIRTNVFNYGGAETSAIVRYYDKDTIIDTQTIFIPANGNSTSEIIWVPLFAGNRTIDVRVDAANDVPEVFEYLNNNATRPNEEVYFFYDDLEQGTSQWRHESVIYRIRGESPLDYMDHPVYTDINGTWDEVIGFKNNSGDFHSADSSFFASEPDTSTSKPILDIALVFDTSNSMGVGTHPNRPIDKAKEAARFLLDYVDDESRVAIYATGASENQRNVTLPATKENGWVTLDEAGRDTLMNDAPHYLANTSSPSSELDPSSWTLIWTSIGEAVDAAKTMGRPGKSVVIVLSDGQDYQGSDTGIADPPKHPADYSGLELGSAVVSNNQPANPGWSPWGDYKTLSKYPHHWGKYFGDPNTAGYWYNVSFSPPKGDWAYGLLNAPLPVYTIGLALETATNRSGDINAPAFRYIDTASTDYRHGDVLTGYGGWDFGTPEYNLFRISNSSGAKYYYSPSSDDLKDVFGKILVELQSLLARSSRATDIGIETKYAVTGEFSLVGMDSAKLTFYHKFNLFGGYNGAMVRVGTVNQSGQWAYKYVQPTQLYNSNLYLKRTEYDDFGTPMLWAWNGISGKDRFDWEYAEFDLAQFIGESRVRANFTLVLYGGGAGGGWWVDDVEVKVSRSNDNPVDSSSRDQWEWTESDSHSGDFSWWNHNATTGHLSGGLDNSLYTRNVDLTKARNVTLTAYMKFNVNASTGRPPDGFRIEASDDNGLTWKPLNLGVRTAWGVSGSESDLSDGLSDGRSPTGLDPDGDNWVEAGTLTRLSTDLSGWRGKVVQLRFRVVTSADNNPYWDGAHYEDGSAGFGGLYIDDVIIYGESIQAEYETVRGQPHDAAYEWTYFEPDISEKPEGSEESAVGTAEATLEVEDDLQITISQEEYSEPGSPEDADYETACVPVLTEDERVEDINTDPANATASAGALIIIAVPVIVIALASLRRR